MFVYQATFWPRNSFNNLVLKNYLFGATNIAKNNDNSKYVYGCCGIAFDEAGSWSFGNDLEL